MSSPRLTRRDFTLGMVSLVPALGVAALPLGSAAAAGKESWNPGISRTAESIHQELTLKASPKRVYEALLDEQQFSKLTGLAATIGRDVGAEFSLFGGQIKGRHLELSPAERIVQVWRSEGWKPHLYSIAKFELSGEGPGTKLVLDHSGFPVGQAEHLASGWKAHYWDGLQKYFAT